MWLKSPYLGIIHDIAITQKYIVIPVIARTTSLQRLQSGEPMWEWDGDLPTMVGLLPRDGDADDVRWFQGPARNTLHFLNAVDEGNSVVMDLPVSDTERSPSQIKRWTFNMNSRNDRFGLEFPNHANRWNAWQIVEPLEEQLAGFFFVANFVFDTALIFAVQSVN